MSALVAVGVFGVFVLVIQAAAIKALLDDRGRAEQAWREERASLLQRIQAPDAAVTQYHYNRPEDEDRAQAVRTDDEPGADEDYWHAKLSREDLARIAAEEELSGD